MSLWLILLLFCCVFSAGFIYGCVWAGRPRDEDFPAPTETTPYTASAQLAPTDLARSREQRQKAREAEADLETLIWLTSPRLQYPHVHAIAQRRSQERA